MAVSFLMCLHCLIYLLTHAVSYKIDSYSAQFSTLIFRYFSATIQLLSWHSRHGLRRLLHCLYTYNHRTHTVNLGLSPTILKVSPALSNVGLEESLQLQSNLVCQTWMCRIPSCLKLICETQVSKLNIIFPWCLVTSSTLQDSTVLEIIQLNTEII